MIQFLATKIFRFEMAHRLSCSYSEECQEVHGHSYKLEITVCSFFLNKDGMVIDFKLLKEAVQPIVDFFDHSFISEQDVGYNPTAENMANRIFHDVSIRLNKLDSNVSVKRVRLWETDTGYVDIESL